MVKGEKFVVRHLEEWYGRYLFMYYLDNYSRYADDIQWQVNPGPNVWCFKVIQLNTVVTLICDNKGNVTEIRKPYEDLSRRTIK